MMIKGIPRLAPYIREVTRDGNRWLAVCKPTSLTDRIALRSTENLVITSAMRNAPMGASVLCNQKAAYSRRCGQWARAVRKARFAGRS